MPPLKPQTQRGFSSHPEPPNWKSRWVLRPVLAAAIIFPLAFVALSSPVLLPRWNYERVQANNQAASSPAPVVGTVAPKTVPVATPALAEPVGPESVIRIPRIAVRAPIIYEPSTKEARIQEALRDGVIHYATTALPGQPGNVAIFGHSSKDWWERGNYNYIFVLLDKLVPGDRVMVDYQSRRYSYEVTGSRVVQPTEMSVLNPTAQPTLTLITCTPAGTSLRRLVVTAKLMDAAPGTVPAGTPSPAVTPAASPAGSGGASIVSEEAALVGSQGVMTTLWNGLASVAGWLFGGSQPGSN